MVGDISLDTLESVEQLLNASLLVKSLELYETETSSTNLRTTITAGITAQLDSVSM